MKNSTKTAQHTPGPWTIELGQIANAGQIFIKGNEYGNHHKQGVCKLGYAYDKYGNDLREQNARLIAAAPKLLKAVELAYRLSMATLSDLREAGNDESGAAIQAELNNQAVFLEAIRESKCEACPRERAGLKLRP